MEYEKFMENYSKELQILDAIDLLQHFDPDALDCLDQLGLAPKSKKSTQSMTRRIPLFDFFFILHR